MDKDIKNFKIQSHLDLESLFSQSREPLLENLSVQVAYLDPEMHIIWNNTEAEEVHQLESGSMIGQKCHQAFYGLNQICTDCPLTKLLETGKPCRGVHQDPEQRIWQISASPHRNKEGVLLGIIYITYEITAIKKTEEALLRKAVMLRNLIDHSRRMIFTKDLEGRFILASKSMVEFHGFKAAEELIGLTNYDFLPKAEADRLKLDDQQVVERGEAMQLEEQITSAKGTYTFLTIKFPLFNEQNQVYAVCGISADITDRVILEEELKRSRTLLDTTEKISKVGGWQYDVEKEKITWTAEAYRIHGLEPKLAPQNASLLIEKSINCYRPEDRPTVMNNFKKCLKHGVPYDLEFRFTNFKGREMWVRTIAEAEFDQGEIVRVSGNIADITEIKETQDALTHLSYHDQLTGLYNRRYLETELKRLNTARQLPLAIVVADINNLKVINDLYGHKKGDDLIMAAAAIFKKCCREEDIVARWGGDEFVLLLPQTSRRKAKTICQRIRTGCREKAKPDLPLSLALGLAVKTKLDHNLTRLFGEAEKMMYHDKLKSRTDTQ